MTNDRGKALDALIFKGRLHRLNAREFMLAQMFFASAGNAGTDTTVTGSLPLTLADALAKPLLSLTREGKVEQRNLPQGFTELDKIIMTPESASDFSQVLDTGLKCTEKTEIRCGLKATDSTNRFVYGASTSNPRLTLYRNGTGGNQRFGNQSVSKSISYGDAHDIVHNATALTVDGVSSAFTAQSAFTTADNITIGNCNGNTGTAPFLGEWYYYQHIEDGVLLRDYVPATDGTHYGLYDKVNGTFLWAEGITGGTTATPTPDHPIDLWCNNGKLKARHQSGLPLKYQKVEYIQSSGTQYVLTPVTDVRNGTFYLDFQMTETPSSGFPTIWGAMSSSSDYKVVFGSGNQKLYNQCGGGAGYVNTIDKDLNRHKVTITTGVDNATVDIDGNLFSANYAITEDTTYALSIFARNRYDGMNNFAKVKVYEAWHKNAQGEYDYYGVPVKDTVTNEYGVYDLVSDTFFGNEGTGDFVAGSAVSDPVEIYTSGTPEVLTVIGKNLFDKATADAKRIYGYFASTGTTWAYASAAFSVRIPCKPNTTYTARYNGSGTQTVLGFGSTSNDDTPSAEQTTVLVTQGIRQNSPTIDTPITLTTGANDKWLIVAYNVADPQHSDMQNNLQIEEGGTATSYEPYTAQTASVPDLLAVADYKDIAEIISGLLTHRVGAIVLNGTENWTKSGNLFYTDIADDALEETHTCLCTHFAGIPTNASAEYQDKIKVGTNLSATVSWSRVQIYPTVGSFANVTALTAWLAAQYAAGTPVIVFYPLATETTESLTPQPLTMSKGTNTVDSENNVPPVSATIVYKKR